MDPETPKTSKIEPHCSCRLAGVHHRQAIHQKPKTGLKLMRRLAGSSWHQAISRMNPEFAQNRDESLDNFKGMPGGFCKIP